MIVPRYTPDIAPYIGAFSVLCSVTLPLLSVEGRGCKPVPLEQGANTGRSCTLTPDSLNP